MGEMCKSPQQNCKLNSSEKDNVKALSWIRLRSQPAPYLAQLCGLGQTFLHAVSHIQRWWYRTHTMENTALFIITFEGNILCLNWLWRWRCPKGSRDRANNGASFSCLSQSEGLLTVHCPGFTNRHALIEWSVFPRSPEPIRSTAWIMMTGNSN